jgi:hypothetical protein
VGMQPTLRQTPRPRPSRRRRPSGRAGRRGWRRGTHRGPSRSRSGRSPYGVLLGARLAAGRGSRRSGARGRRRARIAAATAADVRPDGQPAVYRPTPPAAVPWPAMQRADRSVPHRSLTRDDVPDPRADFEDIVAFAYGFDGYARFGMEGCGELANRTLSTLPGRAALPDDLDELRACLYFEARRWIVLSRSPTPARGSTWGPARHLGRPARRAARGRGAPAAGGPRGSPLPGRDA